MKPAPATLADDIAAWAATPRRHKIFPMMAPAARQPYSAARAKLGAGLRSANRFVLSDSFLDAAVEIASRMGSPNGIEQTLRLARAPFPVTWIEFSATRRFHKQRELGTMQGSEPRLDDAGRQGWLIEQETNSDNAARYSVHTFGDDLMNQPSGTGHGVCAVVYYADVTAEAETDLFDWNDRPLATPKGTEAMKDDKWRYRRLLPYGIFQATPQKGHELSTPIVASHYLLNSCNVGIEDGLAAIICQPAEAEERLGLLKAWDRELWECRGDMRLIGSVLAMIDEIPVQFDGIARSGMRVAGGQARAYLSHRVVNLVYPAHTAARRIARELRHISVSRKRGPVRGHYRLIRRKDGPHRVWVRSHFRGDATKGWVQHEHYAVKGGRDAGRITPREADAPVEE